MNIKLFKYVSTIILMRQSSKPFLDIIIRYAILVLAAIPNLAIFYWIFTPLTIYPTYYLLNIFFEVSLSGNIIHTMGDYIEIIAACVAGSAYYLLLILNLSLKNIKTNKRIKMLLFAFLAFLIVNVLRVFLLSTIFILEFSWFDVAHKLSWYIGSVVLVVAIWFTEVKIFKIKEIPFVSDLKFLYKKSRRK